jgi:hypothetical protein
VVGMDWGDGVGAAGCNETGRSHAFPSSYYSDGVGSPKFKLRLESRCKRLIHESGIIQQG